METVWWILLAAVALIALAVLVYLLVKSRRRSLLSSGSIACQWAKADALRDTGVDDALGHRLTDDLERDHGLDHPIAVRASNNTSDQRVERALNEMQQEFGDASSEKIRDRLLSLQRKARALWTGDDAVCVSMWNGRPCDAAQLYAMEHDVSRSSALEALRDASVAHTYAEQARGLQATLDDTNAKITALQTIALHRDLFDALCTGFDDLY